MNAGLNTGFDSTKLDEFGREVFNVIKDQYPEWLPFIRYDRSWEDRFEINIPSPHPDIPDLWISTGRIMGHYFVNQLRHLYHPGDQSRWSG